MIILEEFYIPFIKNNIGLSLLYFIVSSLTNPFQSVILPKLYGLLFDSFKSGINTKATHTNMWENIKSLNTPGLMYLVLFVYVLLAIMYTTKNYIEAFLIPSFLSFSRQHIFAQTLEKYSTNYKELKVGDYISRVLEVTRYMKNILSWSASDIFPETFAVLTTTLSFFFIDKPMFYILLFNLVLVYSILYIFGNTIMDITAQREVHYFDLSQKISDSFANLMNIYLNNQEKEEVQRTQDLNDKYTQKYRKQIINERNLINVCQFFTIFTYGLCLFKLYDKYQSSSITSATMITTLLLLGNYINYVYKSIDLIVNYLFAFYGQIRSSLQFLEDIFAKKNIRNVKEGIHSGKIHFDKVSFQYENEGKKVFDDFEMFIKPEQKVAIIGPSGSGKSTITKMLVGMYSPTKGRIFIDDIDVSTIDASYLREKSIYVNQQTNLFDMSIAENIRYGNEHVTDKEIGDIMDKYNLHSVFGELEKGIHSQAGVNGSNLSMGMQKVTIILRSLFKKGAIYIFDEPLSSLDSDTRKKVIRLILENTKGKTLIVITHDDEITPFMDKVINIKEQKAL